MIVEHLARMIGGRLVAGDDAADARWVRRAELARLPRPPRTLMLARRALRHPWFEGGADSVSPR